MTLHSTDSIDNKLLKGIKHKKKHKNENSILKELDQISERLKENGYFFSSLDKILEEQDTINKAFFSLNKKIDTVIIKTSSHPTVKKTLPIENLSAFLRSVSNKTEREGKLFSEVQLFNIYTKKNILYAELHVVLSKTRSIDRIIIRGYPKIPRKNVLNSLNLKRKSIINNKKLKEISQRTKKNELVSEIKPPEILFKKDSTLLYLYLNKKKNNSFDGIINFASKENDKGILFSGHLNLKLNNIFDTGEQLNLNWEANGEERQNFSLGINLPNIFNSQTNTIADFKIHKQDSSFSNVSIKNIISYNINDRISIGFTYDSENSQNTLTDNSDTNYSNFTNNFFGFNLNYKISTKNQFNTSFNPSFGKRVSEDKKTDQFKFKWKTSFLYNINNKNAVFIKTETNLLFSKSELDNELYRIGGANSLRGFDEESIFTPKYSFLNLEYHYYTSSKSYFYSISDFGLINSYSSTKKILGIGLGYSFFSNNNQLNLSTVIGKEGSNQFNLNNSKLIMKLTSFF